MKERPILFSGPMVRAILAGSKTQTRRVVMPRLVHGRKVGALRCPYGVPGDGLWVREAWRARADQDPLAPREIPRGTVWYCATGNGHGDEEPSGCAGGVGNKRPSIFMPRWASRITLEITDVRVQRLQEIGEDDAEAEGVGDGVQSHGQNKDGAIVLSSAVGRFRLLWDSINGKRAPWESNPWVWTITFRRLGPGA